MSILLLTLYVYVHFTYNFGSTLCQLSENIEIKSLTGEPNYKSVHLTWFVENCENATVNRNNGFHVHYCELQTWGSQRCKTKTLKDNTDFVNSEQKQYSTVIDNLKMATKYLFHVEANKQAERKAIARVDFIGNELNSDLLGEKIIVPTKGFSAQATKCLPHVSEIEIQTGPYFGGIIMSEKNENCQIQGNHNSEQDRYVIRIDHEKCGSQVDHEQVKTFITVQENLGIFTHSTRRFEVMCSYQPNTLTVRTSFSVPSKTLLPSPKHNNTDRGSRKISLRMVGKEALLLKEESPQSSLKESELNNFIQKQIDSTPDKVGFNGHVSAILQRNENPEKTQKINTTFDRLIHESQLQKHEESASSTVHIILLTISLVIIAAFVFMAGRKLKKWRLVKFQT